MILVTGGAGYIGSHTCVALAKEGFEIAVLDNFCNSRPSVFNRLERICGSRPKFFHGDVRDRIFLDRVLSENPISAVIHFAGLKSVSESVEKPLDYYDNNVRGTLELLGAMQRAGVKVLIFSSSATVYGNPETVPIRESFPRSATNPYGRSKLFIEDILEDFGRANPEWRIARLRYFNPVGAHESGLIGEDPLGIPNNLMPYIAKVGVGHLAKLNIFGGDYPTRDGTGVRDFIHVMDLAEGHLAALRYFAKEKGTELTINLGTGMGVSVLEMVRTFERINKCNVPHEIVERRVGDVAVCFADTKKAFQVLGWQAKRGVEEMCADTWRWQKEYAKGME